MKSAIKKCIIIIDSQFAYTHNVKCEMYIETCTVVHEKIYVLNIS